VGGNDDFRLWTLSVSFFFSHFSATPSGFRMLGWHMHIYAGVGLGICALSHPIDYSKKHGKMADTIIIMPVTLCCTSPLRLVSAYTSRVTVGTAGCSRSASLKHASRYTCGGGGAAAAHESNESRCQWHCLDN
jgi:hypothetical protein